MDVSPVASLDDPRVEAYRHLADPQYLASHGLFVAEGRLVLRRLVASPGWLTRSILVTQAALDSLGTALDGVAAPVYVVDQPVMNDIAGFNIHRGCLALAERPPVRSLDAARLSGVSRVVVLEGVNNPDNVGGIFRSAAAFGVELVVLGPNCGDPLYRKAVRTSMAATLAVPYARASAWPSDLAAMRSAGFDVIALTPADAAAPLHEWSVRAPRVALMVGAEGEGLSPAALGEATCRARIPMTGGVDSLNVTTAASIAMYHWFGLH